MKEFNLVKLPKKVLENIYQDALSPGAKELGKSLQQMTAILKLITTPMMMMGMSCDVLLEKYQDFLINTFKKVPEENRKTPDESIVGPLLENVKNSFDKKIISEMYSNLLATSSDKGKAHYAHPAFVNIISQFDTVDAQLLYKFKDETRLPYIKIDMFIDDSKQPVHVLSSYTYLKGYEDDYIIIASSLQNMERLGIIYGDDPIIPVKFNETFDMICKLPALSKFMEINGYLAENKKGVTSVIKRGCYRLTELGTRFFIACQEEIKEETREI